jgi:hypothetical protein
VGAELLHWIIQAFFYVVFVALCIGGFVFWGVWTYRWVQWVRNRPRPGYLRRWFEGLAMFVGITALAAGTGLLAVWLGYQP